MEQLKFKKRYQHDLFSYVYLIRPESTEQQPLVGFDQQLYQYHFNLFINLAEYLLADFDKYVFVRATPFLKSIISPVEPLISAWHYRFIGDDFYGLGIDKGFEQTNESEEQWILPVSELDIFRKLPEDTYGDKISHLSVMALRQGRLEQLKTTLTSSCVPQLENILHKDEVFMNAVVSKEEGYYHTILIKSKTDIEDRLNAFQHVISSEN